MTRSKLPIFLHVPRSGGTTLRRKLEAIYPREQVIVHDDSVDASSFWAEVAVLDREQLERVQLVAGHLPHGVGDAFERPVGYFTFLREPVARVVSDYRWAQSLRGHVFHEGAQETLRHALASRAYLNFDNLQVRMLAGGCATGVPYGKLTSKHLRRAIANLDDFDLVGLTEDLASDARHLELLYGWKIQISEDEWVNVSTCREPVAEADLELVRRHNQLDALLYREVLARRGPEYSI